LPTPACWGEPVESSGVGGKRKKQHWASRESSYKWKLKKGFYLKVRAEDEKKAFIETKKRADTTVYREE